jgi:hypothetical protein
MSGKAIIASCRDPIDIDLFWGIGNRVNALINGMMLSHREQRPLRLFWGQGCHCRATWTDLFAANADQWMAEASGQSVELLPEPSGQRQVLCHTPFCPPVDPVTISNQKRLRSIHFSDYVELYQHFWLQLKWSQTVLDHLLEDWSGVAFHARTLRYGNDYIPPMRKELDLIDEGSFVATDSEYWRRYYLGEIKGSFSLGAMVGEHDLAARGQSGIVDAAVDLLMLCRATRLCLHAPEGSTFCMPAIHGARVPSVRLAWRSGYGAQQQT